MLKKLFYHIFYILRTFFRPILTCIGKYCYIKSQQPLVASIDDTLNALSESDKSLCRFGDGEFKWIYHIPQRSFQNYNPEMARKLRNIISSDSDSVLICIPDIFGNMNDKCLPDRNFWWYTLALQRPLWLHLLHHKRYYNADVSRCYLGLLDKTKSAVYFARWKKIFSQKNILLVEGAQTRAGSGNDLFDTALSVRRILIPSENAFDRYDAILEAVLNNHISNELILVSAGPTATVLCYELAIRGLRALDIGHLDIEYEWYLRKVSERTLIPGKYINELRRQGGASPAPVHDTKYKKEIIFIIK